MQTLVFNPSRLTTNFLCIFFFLLLKPKKAKKRRKNKTKPQAFGVQCVCRVKPPPPPPPSSKRCSKQIAEKATRKNTKKGTHSHLAIHEITNQFVKKTPIFSLTPPPHPIFHSSSANAIHHAQEGFCISSPNYQSSVVTVKTFSSDPLTSTTPSRNSPYTMRRGASKWAAALKTVVPPRYNSCPPGTPDRSEGDINLTPHREAFLEKNISDETKVMLEEDASFFLHQTLSSPCMNALQGAEGIYITDTQGRKLMDFHGNSAHQVGWQNPDVVAAIKKQLDTLPFCPRRYTNQQTIDLARRLIKIANNGHTQLDPAKRDENHLSRVLFTPGGTTGIGIAMKLARIHTGRYKTISMWESFHGASLDAISIGGESVFRKGVGPLLPGTSHAPPPNELNCHFNCGGKCNLSCAKYVEYMLEQEGDVAAVIAEPIRWTPYIPPKAYWENIRKACDKHGALLIFDEIPNSLGRTGQGMFTYQLFGVTPDIVVIGKGLGGGVFPLSAVLAREKMNESARTHALGHYTHEKSPVGAAAAIATLDFIEREGLVENARVVGEYALEILKEVMKKHKYIYNVRGVGLLIGTELRIPETGAKAVDAAEKVLYKCLELGLSYKITSGNVLTFCPPLIITKEEMKKAVDILDRALTELDM